MSDEVWLNADRQVSGGEREKQTIAMHFGNFPRQVSGQGRSVPNLSRAWRGP